MVFDIEFTGVNANRNYSFPVSIECGEFSYFDSIEISAQTSSLDFSTAPLILNAEAYLVIQGEHKIDDYNHDITILVVPSGLKTA